MTVGYTSVKIMRLHEKQLRRAAKRRGGLLSHERFAVAGRSLSGSRRRGAQVVKNRYTGAASALRESSGGSDEAAAREERRQQFLASRQAREDAVAGLTAEQLADYRANNPAPDEFWTDHGQATTG